MKTKDKILDVLPTMNKFSAVEMANKIGGKVNHGGLHSTAPYTTKILKELCEEGILYQWIIGVGDKITEYAASWEMYYVKADSELAKLLVKNRGVCGYRIR